MKTEEYVPTLEDMNVVLAYLKVLERSDFRSGRFVCEPGAMPFAVHAPETSEFMNALNEHGFVVPFDWPSWHENAEAYIVETRRLDDADLQVVQRLFTTMMRKERFCEGTMMGCCDNGFIPSVLRRLKTLASEVTDDFGEYARLTDTPSGGLALEVCVVRWPEPDRPESTWRRYRVWRTRPTEQQIEKAQLALRQNPRFFRICRRCASRKNAGHMYDRQVCQRCATKYLGIVY